MHVWDLAAAHVAALERFDTLLAGAVRHLPVNLGSGEGTTVRELADTFNRSPSTRPPGVPATCRERTSCRTVPPDS